MICLKAKKYIAGHLSGKIELSEIAKYCGRTPNYINSVFKSAMGITIGKYIAKEKVNMIAELKMTKDITFEEVCLSVGIEDVSYGYRFFKKYTGVSPKKYFSVAINESAWEKLKPVK